MSEFTIQGAPRFEEGRRAEGIRKAVNRAVLTWLERIEMFMERRRDRHILARMSDHDLADIGIGRSEIDRAITGNRSR